MYLKLRVKIPDVHGKLTRLRRGDITYIKYEYDRYYDPEKKYTYPQRATIGKVCADDDTMMIPNEAFLKYFPDAVLSGMEDRTERSSCLRVGTYTVIHKMVSDYSLDKMLGQFFSERDMALLLDLASYSIVEESNVAQHYPDYAYNHPLYSSGMKIYSDASVSDFFKSITKDKSTGFLNEWNAKRNRRERIYISYDSTNKNCQAGEIELAEFGHAVMPRQISVQLSSTIRLDMILRIKNHSFMKPILEVLTTYHSLGPCLVKSLGMAIKKSVSFWTGDISAVEIYAI